MSQIHIVIPARMGSSRFYGKPLVKLLGREMVLRVVDCAKLTGVSSIVVATDDVLIAQCVKDAGFDVHMTDVKHSSGTDRIAQVVTERAWPGEDIVVNVQGDEPLIEPELIEAVALVLSAHPDCVMSTAAHALADSASLLNPNIVKVVLDNQQRALYFSRAPIPFPRDAMRAAGDDGLTTMPAGLPVLRHMGIYAYRVGFLKQYGNLPASPLEHFESLEQLRVLANGHQISVYISPAISAPGVDEPSDVAIVEEILAQYSK